MVARGFVALICLTGLALSGCAALGEMTGINNQVNSFQFGGNVVDKDGTQSFQWRNLNSCAVVQWGGRITQGTLGVVVRDGNGAQVYQGSVATGEQGTIKNTDDGAPGTWTIDVLFDGTTAFMGLNLFSGSNAVFTNDGDALVYAGQTCDADIGKMYSWESTGSATLEWAGQALEGRLTATLKDSAGTTLKSMTVTPAQAGRQALEVSGTAGTWRLQVEARDFTGQIVIRVEPQA